MNDTESNRIQIAKDFVDCHKVFDNAETTSELLEIYSNLIGGVYGEVRQEEAMTEMFNVIEVSSQETSNGNPFLFEFDILKEE